MHQPQHIVYSQQFGRECLAHVMETAELMEDVIKNKNHPLRVLLSQQIQINFFYEPSTRTRFSFESAMLHLGGQVMSTANAKQFSSVSKGETVEDSVQVMSGYADIIVIRHHQEGAVEKAARVSSVPIINAGDGIGQHPTQALLDLYTIQKEFGTIDGLTIALVGDLKYGRTIRSLCYLLGKYSIKKLYLVAPEIVAMRDDIKEYLSRHEIDFEELASVYDIADHTDVIYQTRIQEERFKDPLGKIDMKSYNEAFGSNIIDPNVMSMMKKDARLLHPLPMNGEITPECHDDPRSTYFKQAHNGLPIRMALLAMILGEQHLNGNVEDIPRIKSLDDLED